MDIYNEKFVENMFNRMSKTYGTANYISSFGFTERWRKQCINEIDWNLDIAKGYDLMSGMGETWNIINRESKHCHSLVGLDISPEMNKKAKEKIDKYPSLEIMIREENVLRNKIASNSCDYVVSTFGLKTFSNDQLLTLAKEVNRILKVNGQFSFIEISKPKNILLVIPYMFYLKILIPIIGKIFMGNSSDYRMLGVYCEKFKDCEIFKRHLEEEGLKVQMVKYFFGCATGVKGKKIVA